MSASGACGVDNFLGGIVRNAANFRRGVGVCIDPDIAVEFPNLISRSNVVCLSEESDMSNHGGCQRH